MELAKKYADLASSDESTSTCSVIVKDGKVRGIGSNGSDFHKTHGCKRVELKCETGKGYHLCFGCHPMHHSEARAIVSAINVYGNISGADLYLWGHYCCCTSCWEKIIFAGIRRVFLLENSDVLFNRKNPNNIIGRQFIE
jgi:deoxycytidylate deaminase